MDLSNKSFLICDDSILARKQLKDIINEIGEGATFFEAANGNDAVSLFKEKKPDMAFLDIVMPVMDGTTAVANICKDCPDAEIIMVSSVGTQGQLKAAIEAGAKDFVQKPVTYEAIAAIVEKRL